MSADLSAFLDCLSLDKEAAEAGQSALLWRVTRDTLQPADASSLARAVALLEEEGVRAYRVTLDAPADEPSRARAQATFARALDGLRMLTALREEPASSDAPVVDDGVIPQGLDLPFRVAVAGLASRQTAEARLLLRDLLATREAGEPDGTLNQPLETHAWPPVIVSAVHEGTQARPVADWRDQLLADVFGAFTLLVRKDDGWSDVEGAMATLWATPGILEAVKPGRMQGHGGTEEVPR